MYISTFYVLTQYFVKKIDFFMGCAKTQKSVTKKVYFIFTDFYHLIHKPYKCHFPRGYVGHGDVYTRFYFDVFGYF
jgi:hypothetical protein